MADPTRATFVTIATHAGTHVPHHAIAKAVWPRRGLTQLATRVYVLPLIYPGGFGALHVVLDWFLHSCAVRCVKQ